MRPKAQNVKEYIDSFPRSTQVVLKQVRKLIRDIAPGAEEVISYAIPAYKLPGGYLVYFAGYEKHIGLYPAPTGVEIFKNDFAPYKTGKGSIQFPLDKPMPVQLINKIVKYRLKQINQQLKKPHKQSFGG